MTALVFYILVFVAVGVFFLFIHLVLGKVLRPAKPEPEKLTIYECGEPTIGSAWIQFDLRYYVVALLFVIFDVEVAFFFPWATTFGKANALSRQNLSEEKRAQLTAELAPAGLTMPGALDTMRPAPGASIPPIPQNTAASFARLAMIDMGVFFGVLLVGFAYLWRRGDIDWVRSTAAERLAARGVPPKVRGREEELVGAGRSG